MSQISISRIGFIIGDNQQAVDRINGNTVATGIEPRWVKVHNSIKNLQQLRAGNPHTNLMCRLTAIEPNFNNFINRLQAGESVDPSLSAAEYYGLIKAVAGGQAPKGIYWEVCPPGFASWQFSEWLNSYFLAIMRLLEADGDFANICNWYTGNPHTISDGSGIDGWRPFLSSIQYAAAHGHVVGAQAYWERPDTTMQDSGHWTAYRPLRVEDDYVLPANLKWVPSEYGWDGPGGYRDQNISGPDYRAAINRADMTFRGTLVDGFTLYILQAWGTEWDSFLFWDILDGLLADIVAAGPDTGTPEPPEPPAPNLVENPSFEEVFTRLTEHLTVPNGWSVWMGEGTAIIHSEIENHPPHVLEGVAAGRLWQGWSTRKSAYYQRIDVEEGAEYELTANAFGWSTNDPVVGSPSQANMFVNIGIDPWGGEDASNPEVLWSGTFLEGVRDKYGQLSVKVVAMNDTITIFLHAVPESLMARSDTFWDVVKLVKTQDAPEPEFKVTTGNLRLRTGPGTGYSIQTILPVGTEVLVLDSENGWAFVEVAMNVWPLALEVASADYKTWVKNKIEMVGYCSEAYLE